MNRELFRTFVQPTAWRKNRDYVLYYHNWSWTVVTGDADDEDVVAGDGHDEDVVTNDAHDEDVVTGDGQDKDDVIKLFK